MKAIICPQYGLPNVLQIQEVTKPSPQKNEILIKIKATAVNSADWRLRKADPFAIRLFFGFNKPKASILGGVLSGVVEAIGENVQKFKVGDEVFGSSAMVGFGAYAEYKCLPENSVLALKPTNISHQEAAVIPFGGTTALHFLKKAQIKPGQKILINGASGAVGSAAVQLAKFWGAKVTGVCSSANVTLVKSLGADEVIDYTQEDFTKITETYDIIMDTVNKLPISTCLKMLAKKGTLILSAAGLSEMFQGLWLSLTSKRKIMMGVIAETAEDMNFLKKLIEENQLKAVIDQTFPLEKIVEAHTYAEKGHKKGNVSITI
jgi:NADPH:quinone reductase-like Zn-dependent oxidoreductase